jgi:orotidine-5'-phosphate decarboxylase
VFDLTSRDPRDRIWLPLDVKTEEAAKRMAGPLVEFVSCVKVGLALIHGVGTPQAVALMRSLGFKNVWVDAKLPDIPNTNKDASEAIVGHDVEMFNVFASSGPKSVKAAVASKGRSKVLAVTVLTSLSFEDLLQIGYRYPMVPGDMTDRDKEEFIQSVVQAMVKMSREAGVDGVVCSPGNSCRSTSAT